MIYKHKALFSLKLTVDLISAADDTDDEIWIFGLIDNIDYDYDADNDAGIDDNEDDKMITVRIMIMKILMIIMIMTKLIMIINCIVIT